MREKTTSHDILLKTRADEICRLITNTDYPAVDIIIKSSELRDWCDETLPGKTGLFDMIYLSRFRRLWRQFRPGQGELDV